jgi:predicted RNA-binding Zn-ribbon protein involved in translation (DUF1610 family)
MKKSSKNNLAKGGFKYCSGCGETKVVTSFGKQKSRPDGVEYRCKKCMQDYRNKRYSNPRIKTKLLKSSAAWREKNPDSDANKQLRRKYGITLEQYNTLFQLQNGLCGICGKSESTRRRKKTQGNERLAVDHCHETGVVRGLLCFKCNTAIGSLGDNEEMVMRVIFYLTNSLKNSRGGKFIIGESKL